MKKVLIITFIVIISAIIGGTMLSETDAQVDIQYCQNEYSVSRSKCIADNKVCNAACGENYDCNLACNLETNSCEDAAVDRQRRCLGVWPYDQSTDQDLPVVDVNPVPPESPPQTTIPQPTASPTTGTKLPDQPSFVPLPHKGGYIYGGGRDTLTVTYIDKSITYTPALVDTVPTENMFKDPVFVESPDMEKSKPCAGASCTILVKFQGDQKMVKSWLCAGASCTIPVKFQMKTADLVATKPKLTFNSKDAGSSFTIDIGKWLVDAKTEKGTSELSDTEASGILQEKLAEILNREQATEVDSVTIEVGSSPTVLRERISQSEYNFQRYQSQTPPILLQLDRIGPNPYKVPEGVFRGSSVAVYSGSNVILSVTENSYVDIRGPEVSNITQDANTNSVGGPKIVAEVSAGSMIYVAGRSTEDTMSSMSDFFGAVSNYGVSHKKTAYGIAHDPESGKSVIEIYDGEIEIFDRQTGKVLASLSTVFGADIKRIEIDADGNMKEQIAIPQSQWAEFVLKNQEKTSRSWLWIILAIATAAVGYLTYRKKDTLMKFFKKQPTQ